MYISHSLLASAAFLSFSAQIGARVTQQESAPEPGLSVARDQSKIQGILQRWPLNKVFAKRQEAEPFTDLQCPTDDLYIVILDAAPSTAVQTLCNNLLDIPPATVTLSTTAIVTNFTSRTATSTQTVQISTTVTETATITPAALLRRDSNVAAQFAFANSIMSDVIANGANAEALAVATPNRRQEEALSGFGNACSCETVAPLSTTTVTNTITSNQYKAVGKNVLRVLTRYETKTITTTATVAVSLSQSATPIGSAGSDFSAAAAPNGASTVTVPASITSPASISVVASGSILPVSPPSSSPGSSPPVVVGIPFECPANGTAETKGNALSPQFIVGDLRYEYSVLCDTAVADSNTLAGVQNAANQTACAAQCSLVNHASQRQLCQSASFVPNSDASGGQCFLHGPAQNFARSPGSVTILLTQVSSKSDKCKSLDLVNGPGNATVDTAQAVGSALTEGFSLSTPGLISRSQTGGVFRTFWSSGYTDSAGAYHYSWFEVYASSSAWWAAYATSWTCTVKNTPHTVIIPQPVSGLTSAFIDVTTIVENGTTTVISGTSTFSITGGAGVALPTPVAALGTGNSAAFTTADATGTSNATAGAGVNGLPAPTSAASGALISSGIANETIVPVGTGSQGIASVIVSGDTATFRSIEGGGVIPASPTAQSNSTAALSEGSAAFTASGAASLANATGGSGEEAGTAQPSDGNDFSIEGGFTTEFSTGGSGVIPPSPTNGSAVSTASIAGASNGSLPAASQSPERISSSVFVLPAQHGYDSPTSSAAAVVISSGGAQFSAFEVTATLNLTGGASVIPPPPVGTGASSAASGIVPINTENGTAIVGTGVSSAGNAEITVAGSTAVILSTGGAGSVGPVPVSVNGTELPPSPLPSTSLPTGTSSPFAPINETAPGISSAAGAQNFTVSGGTAVTSASGGFGVIVPSGTAPASEAPVLNATASVSEVVVVASVDVILSTGTSGVIPVASVNISIPTPTEFVSESVSGFAPTPSSNSTTTEEEEGGGPFGVFQFSEEATGEAPGEATGEASGEEVASTGAIPLPSANITVPASVSATPSPSSNGSLPVGTAVFVTSGETVLSSVASGGGIVLPSLNVSAPAPTGPSVGALNISISGSTSIILSTGSGGIVLPSANETTSAPASQPPLPTSIATEDEFNNNFGDRSGRLASRTRTPIGTAPLGTAPIGTGFSAVVLNSTAAAGTAPGTAPGTVPLVSVPIGTGGPEVPINSTVPPVGTAPLVTAPLETGGSAPIVNSTVSAIGTAPLVTAPLVSGSPVPVANSTVPPPPPPPYIPNGGYGVRSTEAASVPQPFVALSATPANSSAAFPTASGSGEQPSLVIPALSVNLTVILPTASGSVEQPSVVIPALSSNLTVVLPTASGSVGQPSASFSILSVNSSAIFPTASGSAEKPSGEIPPVPANRTTIASSGTEQPFVTLPPLSGNSSVAFPTASGSTGPDFSNSEDNRLGRSRSRTSSIPSAQPLITGNVTLSGTAPVPTANASFSGTALVTAVSIPLSTGIALNSTQPSGATGSSIIPVQSANSPLGSSAAPVVSANFTLLATGSSAVPVQSANVTSPALVTALSGTAPVSVPTTVGDFSNTDSPRRGSANSTAFLPTGTASSSIIPATFNSSAPLGTASGPPSIPLSTGVVPSQGIFPIPANSSVPLGTASGFASVPLSTGVVPSQSIVAIPLNSSAPVGGTASAPVPLFTAASVSIAVVSENSTAFVGTGVVSASPTPFVNVTVPLSTGVAFNATSGFATGTGATAASITPSASLNETEGCPTPTAVIIPHTTVITTISYETLLVGPSTCAPTASVGLLGLNATLPSGTGTAPASAASPVILPSGTGTAPASAASPVVTSRSYRRTGQIATQEQIDQACADYDNIVINPDFSFEAANTAFGWSTKADGPYVTFRTENTTDESGTSQFARVLAAATNKEMTISQPLTLCPGKEYKLTSTNRVGNLMSKCQADYYIGDDFVYQASPQETYTRRQEFFTAGNSPADVSQDLRIVVKCNGEAGIPAGTDAEGFMNLDIDDVGVQLV